MSTSRNNTNKLETKASPRTRRQCSTGRILSHEYPLCEWN